MSDGRLSSNALSASVEVSSFLNGDSYVGRELARRVLLLSAGHVESIGDDDDGAGNGGSDVVTVLLGDPCCVRFFNWVESTYVPAYLAPIHASIWSSQLEHRRTLMAMVDASSLSVACRDLFYFRQLLCEIFNIFFLMTKYGIVVERSSKNVDWYSVLELLSSSRYHPYIFDRRLMRFLTSLYYGRDSVGRSIHYPGSSFLHFICRHDHAMLPRVIMKYHSINKSVGGIIQSEHRDEGYGSPAYHFRMMHDDNIYNHESDQYALRSRTFALLRDLFRQGQAYRSANLIGGDDYGQSL